jgi:hypothetical protein
VIDTLTDRAAADTVFFAAATWSRESGARGLRDAVDHGVAEPDPGWVGGAYSPTHPEYYRRTTLGPVPRAPEADTRDVLDEVITAARERAVSVYAFVDESAASRELRRYPGFLRCLEVDMWNKPARRPCYSNPDYREWHLGFVEDLIKSHELDGLTWRADRFGPLTMLAQQPTPQGLGMVSCFCEWCKAKASDLGIDWRRAQTGFRQLVLLNAAVSDGNRPADGAFASYWRLLLKYPEMLSWQSLWTDGQVQLYRDIFGLCRAFRPDIEVGWDIDPIATLSPFVRASLDFSELSHICDFLTLGTHTGRGGESLARLSDGLSRALLGDVEAETAHTVLQAMLGISEAGLDSVGEVGMSAEYVRHEVARGVSTNEGRCLIYAGIDLGMPRAAETEPDYARGTESTSLHTAPSSPRRIADAIAAAREAGAAGVVLGRKYAEMRLDELDAVGQAIRAA